MLIKVPKYKQTKFIRMKQKPYKVKWQLQKSINQVPIFDWNVETEPFYY